MKDLDPQVLSPASEFIPLFKSRVNWVNTMVSNPPEQSGEEYAKLMYIEMMKSIVSGVVFGNKERSVTPSLGGRKKNAGEFDVEKRKGGSDWAYLGDTMTGFARLDNVRDLLMSVIEKKIEGGYIGKDCQHRH